MKKRLLSALTILSSVFLITSCNLNNRHEIGGGGDLPGSEDIGPNIPDIPDPTPDPKPNPDEGDNKPTPEPTPDPIKKGTVNIITNKGGSAEADVSEAEVGTEITITVNPDSGYEIKKVTHNGNELHGSNNVFKFTLVEGENKVVIDFDIILPVHPEDVADAKVIYQNNSEFGSVSGKTYGDIGDIVTLEIYPAVGYKVYSVFVNDNQVNPDGNGEYRIRLVKGDNVVKATFVKIDSTYEPYFKDEQVNISFKHCLSRSNADQLKKLAQEFKTLEPNVNIEFVTVEGGYAGLHDQTVKEFNTGEYGDFIINQSDFVSDYISAGKAVDVKPFVDDQLIGWTEEEKSDFSSDLNQLSNRYILPGLYSLPYKHSTEALFYKADKLLGLELKGVNSDKPITEEYMASLTWEELFNNLCPALIKYDIDNPQVKLINKENSKGYSIVHYENSFNLISNIVTEYDIPFYENGPLGDTNLLFNNSEFKDKLLKLCEYAKKNYITTQSATDGWYASDYFRNNMSLIVIQNITGSKYLMPRNGTTDIRVTRIPNSEAFKERHNLVTGPDALFLKHRNANGEWDLNRQKASWLFYKFITNNENCTDLALNNNCFPLKKSFYNTKEFNDNSNPAIYPTDSLEALDARILEISKDLNYAGYYLDVFKGLSEMRMQIDKLVGIVLKPSFNVDDLDTFIRSAYDQIMLAM